MKGISIRLFLTSDVLAKLVSVVVNRFKHFVRIGRTQPAGEFHQVDIRILDAYECHGIEDESYLVTVTREMVGELFDLLGIFPRTEEGQATLTQITPELQFVIKELEAIRGLAIEVHDSGRHLERSEEIMKVASRARHKVALLLGISQIQ